MTDTFLAAAVLLVVVIPGAVATVAYEWALRVRAVLDWQERTVRFVIATAVIFPVQALIGWPAWQYLLNDSVGGERVNRLVEGPRPGWGWALLPAAYVAAPAVLGWLVGRFIRRHDDRLLDLGQVPTSAGGFDYMVQTSSKAPKLVVVRLRQGGQFVGGLYGENSWASPRSSASKELVLEAGVRLDADGQVVWIEPGVADLTTGSVYLRIEDCDVIRMEEVIQ